MGITKTNRIYLFAILGLFTFSAVQAQENSYRYDLSSMAEKNQLEVFNRQVSTFSEDDKNGIRLTKNENDGVAWMKHVIFSNGIVELDIRGKNENPSFVGVAFHGVDNKNFDVVYFRPFNFQSTDSVHRIHAVQYEVEPDFPWEVLRDKFNGKYEKAINPAPDGTQWFHVKIMVNYPLITVFVNGNQEPCLKVEKLNERTSGKIGLWVGNESDGDFANLEINSLN